MKKLLFISLGLLFFFPSPSFGTGFITLDGRWWNSLNHYEKIVAVEGLNDGYTLGWFDSSSKHSDFSLKGQPTFSHPFGVYVNQISNFYLIYPKQISNVTVVMVFRCLNDRNSDQKRSSCLKNLGIIKPSQFGPFTSGGQ